MANDENWMLPMDEFNLRLQANVNPTNWQNPRPADKYHLVVIGGGTAGLVTAAGAAGLGARVALIERHALGGDCLNFGCVPSKAIIRSARMAADIATAGELGIAVSPATIDFAAVMERMRRLRAAISIHDSAARFKSLGVDVFLGSASFAGRNQVHVAGETLNFKQAVIATGAKPRVPPIPGLADVGYLTNETVFSLTSLPQRLAVIGGGPIGCELAQSFSQLGSQVTVIQRPATILPREVPDAAAIVQQAMVKDGVQFQLDSEIVQVERGPGTTKRLLLKKVTAGQTHSDWIEADEILVATGRLANVAGLQLEKLGIEVQPGQGIVVNDRLQTSCKNIFAAGDVCSSTQFTHSADFQARIVIQNALFWGRAKASRLLIPWCTYTSPEIAQVGLTPQSPELKGRQLDSWTQPFSQVDRAIVDELTAGFVRVYCRAKSDQIVGATVVAPHAGELIAPLTMAIQHRLGLRKIAATIHAYPTYADAIRKLGDQYNRGRLTPWVKRLLSWWLSRTI